MAKIKLVVFDIDGVLTDGNIYVDSTGKETKRFRLTEIDALNDIERSGILIAAITGEDTSIVDVFERKANWSHFVRGCKDKISELKRIITDFGIDREEVCYIGDGKYDVESIKYAGLGVCPANAIQEVKDIADIVLAGFGGESCIYELYQMLRNKNMEQENIKRD